LAAAGGGGGALVWDGVVEQAAAIDATAATNTTRKMDIGVDSPMKKCRTSVRRLLTESHQDSSKEGLNPRSA
jgi:hypothetical protein